MVHDYKNIAIIGAGASGCMCAYFLQNNIIQSQSKHTAKNINITLFDKSSPLRTLLPTGGGRCNLAHAEYDIHELAQNYPRGEKFLYSVFSKFSTADTLETFANLGINCYSQDNGRIFPNSNSAKEVRETILNKINKFTFAREEVINIEAINGGFKIKSISSSPNHSISEKNSVYFFTDVILAIGGHSGLKLATDLGINIIEQKPSLVGLNTKENFKSLSGTVIKKVSCNHITEDLLFTHFGVSGPLIYKISSIKAFDETPYKLNIDLAPDLINLQADLNRFPHKEIKNILNNYLPQKIVSYILKDFDETTKAHKINGKERDLILEKIHNFCIEITGSNKGEETVSAGGIDLNEVNPKTMELKKIPNLYAIGEVLNIDGFCGGFNLQNAWSTAFICAEALSN